MEGPATGVREGGEGMNRNKYFSDMIAIEEIIHEGINLKCWYDVPIKASPEDMIAALEADAKRINDYAVGASGRIQDLIEKIRKDAP